MARFLPVISDDIKNIITLEGRPVRLRVDTRGSGIPLVWDATGSDWIFPEGTSRSAGSIGGSAGRAIYIESITVTCDQSGLIEGFFSRNENAPWLGGSDPNVGGAIDDAYTVVVGEGGGGQSIPIGVLYGEFFWFTAVYRPTRKQSLALIDPNISITIKGYEITNDFNFRAQKRLLFAGDSLSWSLVGDWRTQDQFGNLLFSKENSSQYPFPTNFGDTLAAFRLVKRVREEMGEDIRLVNKGFGGSKLIQEQWYSLKNQLYTLPWNIFILEAGANDAGEVQTPLFQLTFKERMRDFVRQRNEDGKSQYPMVFCNAPSLDDRSGGLNSRNNLDVRVPVNSETYDAEFDSGTDTAISFSTKTNRYYKVSGDGTNPMSLSNGVEGEVYRVDFWDDTTLLTGTTPATYPYVQTLEALDGAPPSNGQIKIDAGTVIYFHCVSNGQPTPTLEYHELERVRLIGRVMASGDTLFDPVSPIDRVSHFITSVNTLGRTEILGPAINNLAQTATIDTIGRQQGYVTLNLSSSNITEDDWPTAGQIDTNDVWVRVSGMTDSAASNTLSWADVNGFYRVVSFVVAGGIITSIDIKFDSRDGAGRDFSGTYTGGSGTVEVIKSRSYVAMFEGNESSDTSNCSFFANGDNEVGDYIYRVQLKESTGSTFDLTEGKGIALSCYQQGNVIFLNEIVSGDIVNTGVVYGASSLDNYYDSTNEYGKTRTQIVNTNIETVCTEYVDDNVYLIELNDASDIESVSESGAGRLRYLTTTAKGLDPTPTTEILWKVGDLIEDPVFKRVGNSGTNECIVGSRVHRSPRGHELMYLRMWDVVETIKIPN